MKIDRLTPKTAILEELGSRLARIRKRQGQTQEALSRAAGIGVATLRRIEDGRDSQLGSWLKILKALQLESSIEALLPETFDSPMAQALTPKQRRRRGPSAESGFVWGDEKP